MQRGPLLQHVVPGMQCRWLGVAFAGPFKEGLPIAPQVFWCFYPANVTRTTFGADSRVTNFIHPASGGHTVPYCGVCLIHSAWIIRAVDGNALHLRDSKILQ